MSGFAGSGAAAAAFFADEFLLEGVADRVLGRDFPFDSDLVALTLDSDLDLFGAFFSGSGWDLAFAFVFVFAAESDLDLCGAAFPTDFDLAFPLDSDLVLFGNFPTDFDLVLD